MQRTTELGSIIRRVREISANLTGERMFAFTSDQRKEMRAEETSLLLEYMENLPHRTVSRCPICSEELCVTIDLGGLDGPWWWYNCPVGLPAHQRCVHYRTFLGAIDLHDRQPTEVVEGVIAGPGAPFVVDRLLGIETMRAVLSSFETDRRDTGYLIAYFSEAEVDQGALHQEWRHKSYPLYNDEGAAVATEAKFDAWNFELEPSIVSGQLSWISPGDPAFSLRQGLPCPFVGLAGTHKQQLIAGGRVQLVAAPANEDNAQFERV